MYRNVLWRDWYAVLYGVIGPAAVASQSGLWLAEKELTTRVPSFAESTLRTLQVLVCIQTMADGLHSSGSRCSRRNFSRPDLKCSWN